MADDVWDLVEDQIRLLVEDRARGHVLIETILPSRGQGRAIRQIRDQLEQDMKELTHG